MWIFGFGSKKKEKGNDSEERPKQSRTPRANLSMERLSPCPKRSSPCLATAKATQSPARKPEKSIDTTVDEEEPTQFVPIAGGYHPAHTKLRKSKSGGKVKPAGSDEKISDEARKNKRKLKTASIDDTYDEGATNGDGHSSEDAAKRLIIEQSKLGEENRSLRAQIDEIKTLLKKVETQLETQTKELQRVDKLITNFAKMAVKDVLFARTPDHGVESPMRKDNANNHIPMPTPTIRHDTPKKPTIDEEPKSARGH